MDRPSRFFLNFACRRAELAANRSALFPRKLSAFRPTHRRKQGGAMDGAAGEIRGSLHCAGNGEAVPGFGRDDELPEWDREKRGAG
jgi:hypothetical protein